MGAQILFGFLFIAGGTVGVVFWLALMKRAGGTAVPGILKIKKRKYSFEAGDNLIRFGGAATFSGMDIHLKTFLPHMYLDGGASDYMGKSQYIFQTDERRGLNPAFGDQLRLYSPAAAREIAHSIFNDGTLSELLNASFRYDVEIMDDHVRLIVPAGNDIGHNEIVKADMGKVAMIIMKEVDRFAEPAEEPKPSKSHPKKHHGKHHGK